MITLRKDPFFSMIDEVFDSSRLRTSPQVSITKDDMEYKVLLSVPGLSKDDLKITIKDRVIKIDYVKDEKTETNTFVESFSKTYSLPDNVKEKDIEGKVENGVLLLSLPFDKKKPLERVLSLN
jgi:HSP20 family protein